ncbi:pimeloyl-ACP methyl ester carboxylesterase [Nocardioides sp. BE266]|uniref:epoxide hydrolase family protein n=1 Tax=Nocardioides sp. BE266 TaxID=2817725 RepID=UPI002866FC94|nr:epoxide hydrolase [Nocardioides sp. BE266]MDR7254203.1 pimeloyl-ACP methyl ester carboxylesterase [Nocardioides sp. BE266]
MLFEPAVAADDVLDLRRRLASVRWPSASLDPGHGTSLERMKHLVSRWERDYDFERLEQRLRTHPQIRLEVDGVLHHAVYLRSPDPAAVPLLLGHGWPSTCYEFDRVVERLTQASDHAPAFHVVCPSLPGYAYSGKPTEPGWGPARTADAWVSLMSALGHDRFVAHGGDWGASVSTELAIRHPDRLLGLHLSMPLVQVTEEDRAAVTTELGRAGAERERAFRRSGYAYALLQMTRPQTIGYSLEDSPVGLLAWLTEKLDAWSDWHPDRSSFLDDDAVLDVTSVYWLTRSATSAARMYAEGLRSDLGRAVTEVPTGCSIFGADVIQPPRSAVERRYRRLVTWSELEHGGHFPAAEVPDIFIDEIRAFARGIGLTRAT